MKVCELSDAELRHRLRNGGLVVRTGPFDFRVISDLDAVAAGVTLLYAHYGAPPPSGFADFTVELVGSGGLRRWVRPQVKFRYDGRSPFVPLPIDHAFPLMEWAMNWCISTQAHHFLILHAAVIERDGRAAILAAPPGSGKSTLCAGLISRGWRLLSDELALISPADGSITPLARPVSLKNQSLDVIRAFEPAAVLNDVTQ
jgi:HprK-related kinase A